ncbi:MAG: MerR family DNA-binding transcriptional regulator [Solirubrobacteraceae bacterium]
MRARVTIGDFSRASHLSIKALRHYHDVGLLEHSDVTPAAATGTTPRIRSQQAR